MILTVILLCSWVIFGSFLMIYFDPFNIGLYLFVSKHENIFVSKYSQIIWPYVLWLWYQELNDRD